MQLPGWSALASPAELSEVGVAPEYLLTCAPGVLVPPVAQVQKPCSFLCLSHFESVICRFGRAGLYCIRPVRLVSLHESYLGL